MAKDYYDVLGVGRNASQDEIKRAYRDLAFRYHPDRNKDKGAEAKFREANESYAVLGDPEKRRQYDMFGPAGFGQRFSEEDIFRGFDFEKIFREMGINMNFSPSGFGNVDNIFDSLFGFGGVQQPIEQTGVNVYLSFDELQKGIEKDFQVQHYARCENCNGTGGEPGTKQTRCTACSGTGQLRSTTRTPFGMMQTVATCNRCGGAGRIYEKQCRVCRGKGTVLLTEKFHLSAGKSGAKEDKKKGWGIF